ncbi:Obg family GTPase CgtA [Candidatus Gottesmanbacteria bacterium RIFCSPHIGHO2_01_FULL_39_10]|uniref:Obg family GTPase CgtA n=1 Tax=Candidatus Gottesmanbacteria bacterium RIFCSPHIGHO2_01_FULL_39_10 TaxID=1798375 RepID=A0A1F5ZS52_9BACT|nr:MAG: Obg family GTPase CgtA [Candidatus Gottesmanbacteria bacterium RIFCSPHIGHO2_01_FULL_39_10]
MFIDEVDITFQAGNGADGRASFYPGYKSGPDGGDGGKGGDIYVRVTSDLTMLSQFRGKRVIKAEDGEKGGKFRKTGRNGKDITITLPLGSILTDGDTGEVIELNDINQKILLCRGGSGGKGTYALASPSNTTPLKSQPGIPGEKRHLTIVLKLIADYGLIGLPSAGKSSLLNTLTSANVKVADYPFTTLTPNLGVMEGKVIADIPGLIEGASSGKGLGIKFLKHIEKVNLILHCISAESENIEKDYKVVRDELGKFNPLLLQKKEIILLTKSDEATLPILKKKQKKLEKYGKVYPISILDDESIGKLKKILRTF